jgi:hypothetical protein
VADVAQAGASPEGEHQRMLPLGFVKICLYVRV